MNTIKAKILIKAKIGIKTGLHIGGSSDFAPIGAVDSPVIKDSLSNTPIIPGSSLKGKMRTLLAKVLHDRFPSINEEKIEMGRLFGLPSGEIAPRLQFYDCFLSDDSKKRLENANTDLYLTEVKFENTINRANSAANPRQLERVPAGAEFELKLTYNVEDLEELKQDFETLKTGFKLMQLDYIGGHGSRGYGKVLFREFSIDLIDFSNKASEIKSMNLLEILKEVEEAGTIF